MEALDLICRLIDYQRETVDIARRLSARERPRIINGEFKSEVQRARE
jgi:hypothetical protein